jgi:hypothetical protein
MDIVNLDLRVVDLYGFEHRKNKEILESMIFGIENGDTFPPVPVKKISESVYWLSADILDKNTYSNSTYLDGGHHRALAHYIVGEPLSCFLVDNAGPVDIKYRKKIQDLVLVSNELEFKKRQRLKYYCPIL